MESPLSDDVFGLLNDLRITVNVENSESALNGSLELILHIMECVNALRQVNELIPQDQLELTGGLFVKAQNEFSAAIGRILMFVMSTKPKPNLTELLQITVGKILSLFPESASHDSYRNGTSLLHHAVSKAFADVRLVEVIHDANPVCAGNPDNEGALPLHRAVANADISLEVVRFLIAVYPAGTSTADLEGYLPLHWAVNTDRPNIPVIEELIDAYPDGCNTTCNMGSLPMHWAVDRAEPEMTVVYLLMKSYAKALRKGCSAGFLPIHRCVDRPNPSIQCMKALIKKYPKSLEQDNCDGQLPLHRCVDRCDPSLEAVAMLIQAYPGALDTPDVEGYVPLHIALDGESPCIPVVKLLIESCMESSTMKTQDGLLPLHYVLNCQDPSEELIALLLNCYPEGAEALAVDLYPEDPMADPLTWPGPWKKRKWTPLTRALELGNPIIVDMIRGAIEAVHGELGGDAERNRPVSTDSRRSKGQTRPKSNTSQQQPSRPTSHNSNGIDESTPLKTELISNTTTKKPPTSGFRGAATNNYLNEQVGDVGGARNFSPAGESPAHREIESAQPVSIPTAVPPKQLFPAVGSASASVTSKGHKSESRAEAKNSLPEVSPRGFQQPAHSPSEGSLLKAPVQPEVEEEVPVKVSRHREKKDRESRTRHRDKHEEGEDVEKKARDRKERSRSRARPDGEEDVPAEEGEESKRRHHRHHHRRHHRHHHRHRDGEEKGDDRKKRLSKERDSTEPRKASNSSGPGHPIDRDESSRYPNSTSGGNGDITMSAEREADIAERLRKLELMEAEIKRKEEEAAEVSRQAYLKAREAEETLQRAQQGIKNNQRGDIDGEYSYSDRQNSHKFPTAAPTNSSDPKFLDDSGPSPDIREFVDDVMKSLEDFNADSGTGVSHKFPPARTYELTSEPQ